MDDESRPVGTTGSTTSEPQAEPVARHRQPRRRSWGRRLAVAALVVVLALVAAGGAFYWRLNHNLTTVEIAGGIQGLGAPGRPLNIAVLGSDSRSSKENCQLGGVCDEQSHNADVQMVVHISGDRSRATAMSIPRDTVIPLPECAAAAMRKATGSSAGTTRGRINSTLIAGPSCTITAIQSLTGLSIDHFAMIDFAGVIAMSDAIGGVDVCVDKNVYDPMSRLKLAKGRHTLKGEAALQFLRTRHGFGDGGDIGRTVAQHIFLSSMLRSLESAGTLLNPSTAYSLADTATSALTVDSGLGVRDLASLAVMGAKIPTDDIAFVTMPTTTDPQDTNAVVPAANAATIFARLASDQPLGGPTPAPGATTHAATRTTSAAPTATTTATTSPAVAATPTVTATATDYAASAKGNTGCAQVSAMVTVSYQGFPVTPSRAYEMATQAGVKDSAP